MSDTTKDKARKWLADQIKKRKPLPSQKEIRRSLGWDLLDALRKKPKR